MGERRSIGEVAGELGVNPKTIRYYESIGLIPPVARDRSGYRVFTAEDTERLKFILKAKHLEFSLEDIGEILETSQREETPCGHVAEAIEDKLGEVQARIESLLALKRELTRLADESKSLTEEPHSEHDCICPVIQLT